MRLLSVIFAFILAGTLNAQNKINRYEYWFDNNFSGRITTAVTPVQNFTLNTSLSASALLPGLHVMHIRFCDDSVQWSSCASQFFFRVPPTTASTSIIGYEYWFDNNFAGRIFTSITSQQNATVTAPLNSASLVQGLHTVHVRFIDSEGNWSTTLSQFFFRNQSSSSTTQEVNAYQYWFDNNYSSAVTSPVGPGQNITLLTSLNAASLTNGLHTVHLRFRDNSGDWSSVISQFFFRNTPATTTAIDTYQYWYDNNYPGAITLPVAPQQNITVNTNLSAAPLTNGLHAFHIRFRDSTGKWSSVVSQFFHVYPTTGVSAITAYRYWFDENDSTMIQTQITAAQDATVNTSISLINIPQGTHTVHFQFLDSLGKWSSATTDTIQKLALPIAMFTANDTIFCDSGTVAFMDHSIDADQFLWYFGDGDSSNVQYPTHLYGQPGLYTVQLTVSDSASGLDTSSTRIQYIRVYHTPLPILATSPNDSICFGQSALITADTAAIYSWSSSETTQSISVFSSGDYWATVSNTQFAACSTITDTVHITVMPLPAINLGSDTTICEGNQILLDASGTGSVYNWSTGSTATSVTVNNPGAYWVAVTSSFGCQKSDTIVVGIDSLPLAGFTYNANGAIISFTDNSLYALSWYWDFGDGNYSSQQNPIYVFGSAGTYTVTLIVSNACDSDTITDIIIITGTEINAKGDNQMFVYPNPASDFVNIKYTIANAGEVTIDIINVNGELVAPVLNTDSAPGTVHTATLNVTDLADGVYLVRMKSGDTQSATRLVIAR